MENMYTDVRGQRGYLFHLAFLKGWKVDVIYLHKQVIRESTVQNCSK